MDAIKTQEGRYTTTVDQDSVAFSKIANSFNHADTTSKEKEEFLVDDKFSKTGYSSLNEAKKSDGKWNSLKAVLIIVVVIIAIIGFSLGLVAVIKPPSALKILTDTQTELSALRQSNIKLKENFENLIMNFQNLSARLTNSSITTTLQAEPGWYTPNNGYQYKLNSGYQTWNDSRKWCMRIGGDLATVGMRDYSTRLTIGRLLLIDKQPAWVGLHDITLEGRFEWIDGVMATYSNALWIKGQPNSYAGNEDCGNIRATANPLCGMNDSSCSSRLHGICEKTLI